MEIKELNERIEKKQNQIKKIEKRLAKWQNALVDDKAFAKAYCFAEHEGKWYNNQNGNYELSFEDYKARRYNEYEEDCNYEIRSAKRDLDEANETLKKYETALAIEVNRENAPKIEVLVNFLNSWKIQANAFYHEEAKRLYQMREQHLANYDTIKKMDFQDYKERRQAEEKEYRRFREEEQEIPQIIRNIRTYSAPYIDEEQLEKFLNREVKNKYEDMVQRISKVVGEIEDCNKLKIGGNGSINGIVKGSKTSARVETILCGGYNIQCLHYRVIVNEIH